MKCFYHSADLDGHCSGAIVKHFFPNTEMIGYNYGQPFPMAEISKSDLVYIVDVSLPMDQMFELRERCGRLNWIDHHISAIKEHNARCGENPIRGLRRTDRAACELVWEFLHDVKQMPEAVRLLGIYDSWRFTAEQEREIKEFQYGFRTFRDTRPEVADLFWEKFLDAEDDSFVEDIKRCGKTIFAYQLIQNEKSCRSCAFETELGISNIEQGTPNSELKTLKCIAINSNLMNSDVFKSVWDPAKYDAMLCFYWSNKGFWRVSIYSTRPEIDCSVYAKSYGGGGHKGAAGFQCSELPFALGKIADRADVSGGSKGGE